MRSVLYFATLLVGAAAGGSAALYGPTDDVSASTSEAGSTKMVHSDVRAELEYVRLNSQFVIPVVTTGKIKSLVAISLTLEVEKGSGDVATAREPKLRDVFLRVLFDHANAGGFDGEFTETGNLAALRRALTEVAHQILGDSVSDVLITDIARQDI